MNFRAIEFFSGLGGWRYAMKGVGTVSVAFDVSEAANATYRFNFGESPRCRELSSVPLHEVQTLNADTWLLSPPCQPFCRMGQSRGLDDPRSAAFVHLMNLLPRLRPRRLVLENVEGFLESRAFELLAQRLNDIGLVWRSFRLCPLLFGIPNRRPRVFVVASAYGLEDNPPPSTEPRPLSGYLDSAEERDLYLSDEVIARHGPGMDIVTAESRRSACFIGGYGKRFVGSGSFLKTQYGTRRFSPTEICRLCGYPPDFRFPPGITLNNQYKLLGNGLNLAVAEWVLRQPD